MPRRLIVWTGTLRSRPAHFDPHARAIPPLGQRRTSGRQQAALAWIREAINARGEELEHLLRYIQSPDLPRQAAPPAGSGKPSFAAPDVQHLFYRQDLRNTSG